MKHVARTPRPRTLAMSKEKESPTTQPLSGVRVLVGRAKHQAGALSTELSKLGAQVLEIPFIEIRKPRSFKPLDSALRNLRTYDWLILTSVNGVDAMWERIEEMQLQLPKTRQQQSKMRLEPPRREPPWKSGPSGTRSSVTGSGALAPVFRVAAIGPATKKAIEQRGLEVDVVPKEYVAESVVRSLKGKVRGKRVLLVRAKVARDVIPRELRKAGAHVDVVEAYETVVPQSSRRKLQSALKNEKKRPHVVVFTSSSTVKNFTALVGKGANFKGIRMASIGPVTSATLRDCGLNVDIAAREFTIPGLISAISKAVLPKTRS